LTLNPKLQILDPNPYIYALSHEPVFQNSESTTLNPKVLTLKTKLLTQNPKP